jgi:hypothetical protein
VQVAQAMNNVIVIVIDSLFTEGIGANRTAESFTPFYDEMIQKSLYAPNVFSYGPYTDAATKGLFSGNPTLNNYGYYFGINNEEYNPYRVFKEAGYTTYSFYYPYYLISSKVEEYIDHSIYTSGFVFSSCWHGKFSYYSEILKHRDLNEKELTVVTRCLELVFDCWIKFYENIIKHEECSIMLQGTYSVDDLLLAYDKLLHEYNLFFNNDKNYTIQFLKEGMNSKIAQLNIVDHGAFVDQQIVKDFLGANRKAFRKLSRISLVQNIKNNQLSLKIIITGLIELLKGKRQKNLLNYLYNYLRNLFPIKFFKYHALRDNWQYEPSAKTQLSAGVEILKERDRSKPFYMFFHLEEPHEYLSFFTFDSKDRRVLNAEMALVASKIKAYGENFKGNVLYPLSLLYVDNCLREFYSSLDSLKLLEDTTILICADHGSSYTFNPLRQNQVNNFYRENYHTPLLLHNRKHIVPTINHDYWSADSVFSTLFWYSGIVYPSQYSGPVITRDVSKGYVITEYMGPGCPDMISRDVWISIRNERFSIAYIVNINESVKQVQPYQIFNLSEDPSETCNRNQELVDHQEVGLLIDILSRRFEEIQMNSKNYLASLIIGLE